MNSGFCERVEALKMSSIGPVSSANTANVTVSFDDFCGDGGRGIFDGDLTGEGRFVERSARGCWALDGDLMVA